VRAYFEAALADPPASAAPDTSSAAARITNVPVIVALYIADSIWFETTQTEQTWSFLFDDSVRRLVVPSREDDPASPEAQESIIECPKDQQGGPSVKKMAKRGREDENSR
jgi:hypothetical protein